jgi:DAK2 domain fusion protein YloV
VATPVEGTVLTVARAAADGAAAAAASLAEAVTAALAGAVAALDRTPEQLVALGRAGVVDAGGQGFVVILDALARTVTGGSARPRPLAAARAQPPVVALGGGFQYEVQYLLDADEAAAAAQRERLTSLGDSVVVAGTGGGSWNVHAHVDDVGAAIEAGVAAGPTRSISVVRFADQVGVPAATSSAVVALVEGDGLARLFAREGVSVVDIGAGSGVGTGGDAGRRVVAAAAETGAREVVLLPNDPQATTLAETAGEQLRSDGTRVVVIPTRSPVQGLAAVAVHDGKRRFDDDVVAMAEAAAATRFAEVCVAGGQALTSVGMCRAGDVLGLIDGDVVEIGADVLTVALSLVDRLLRAGGELVTVLLGADAPDGAGEAVGAQVRRRAPLTDVAVYRAGQPDTPLIVGVE